MLLLLVGWLCAVGLVVAHAEDISGISKPLYRWDFTPSSPNRINYFIGNGTEIAYWDADHPYTLRNMNGSESRAVTDETFMLPDSFTIRTSIYLNQVSFASSLIAMGGDQFRSDNMAIEFYIQQSQEYFSSFQYLRQGTSSLGANNWTSCFPFNKWTELVCTKDKSLSELMFYVDGELHAKLEDEFIDKFDYSYPQTFSLMWTTSGAMSYFEIYDFAFNLTQVELASSNDLDQA